VLAGDIKLSGSHPLPIDPHQVKIDRDLKITINLFAVVVVVRPFAAEDRSRK
jgi:hypothetical protein